jgi:7,8-dihydro-6-hydroxymethylpterin-pyrophosphokinase
VNTFINLEPDSLASDIKDIVDIAQEEAEIEDALTIIRKRWEDRKFVLTR